MPDQASGINWQKFVSKDILAWILLAANLIYGYAVKSSTSDRMQQQQMEDHIAINDMRDKLSKLTADQREVAGKLDFMIQSSFQQQQRRGDGK